MTPSSVRSTSIMLSGRILLISSLTLNYSYRKGVAPISAAANIAGWINIAGLFRDSWQGTALLALLPSALPVAEFTKEAGCCLHPPLCADPHAHESRSSRNCLLRVWGNGNKGSLRDRVRLEQLRSGTSVLLPRQPLPARVLVRPRLLRRPKAESAAIFARNV